MSRKVLFAATAVAAAIILSGCSVDPTTTAQVASVAKQEPPKAPEAIGAHAAYFEMYKPARAWAPDLLALTLKSGDVPNVTNADGKAGQWTAVFVSPSRHEARTFTYAVANSGADIRKGINVSDKQVWNGATQYAKGFVNAEFSVNSDAAYKVASEKASGWLKTHPKAKATFTLGNTNRFPAPVWYIMWGTSKEGYAVYVNATTGAVVTM